MEQLRLEIDHPARHRSRPGRLRFIDSPLHMRAERRRECDQEQRCQSMNHCRLAGSFAFMGRAILGVPPAETGTLSVEGRCDLVGGATEVIPGTVRGALAPAMAA